MSRSRVRAHILCLIIAALLIGSAAMNGQVAPAARVILQTIGLPAIDRGLGVVPRQVASGLAGGRRALSVAGKTAERIGAGGASYTAGRVVVKFRGGVSTTLRLGATAAVSPSATMAPRPAYANADIVNIGADEDAEAVARQFSQRDDVEYAQADYRVHPYFVPNDTFYRYQWNFPQIDLERAWDIQLGGSPSIVVAVLDSGIAYRDVSFQYQASAFTSGGLTYPSLGNIVVPFLHAPDLSTSTDRFVLPVDFIWNDNTPVDLDGHGTHVSGTIGQLTNNNAGLAGVAFNVKLMPVKVISGEWDEIFGAPNSGTDSVVAQGIRYATDNGAKVINMSIGRNGSPAPVVEDAMRYAVCTGAPSSTCSGKGVFIAVAGGNDFQTGNPVEVLAEPASRIQGAVSVAAVDCNRNRAYYSSTASYVEIAAPGGSDETLACGSSGTPGYVYQQTYDPDFTDTFNLPPSQYTAPRFDVLVYEGYEGTSMATPHVAGLAALLMSLGLTDPAAIETVIEQSACQAPLSSTTCVNRGAAGRDDNFGFGQINARNTLRGLGLAR